MSDGRLFQGCVNEIVVFAPSFAHQSYLCFCRSCSMCHLIAAFKINRPNIGLQWSGKEETLCFTGSITSWWCPGRVFPEMTFKLNTKKIGGKNRCHSLKTCFLSESWRQASISLASVKTSRRNNLSKIRKNYVFVRLCNKTLHDICEICIPDDLSHDCSSLTVTSRKTNQWNSQ